EGGHRGRDPNLGVLHRHDAEPEACAEAAEHRAPSAGDDQRRLVFFEAGGVHAILRTGRVRRLSKKGGPSRRNARIRRGRAGIRTRAARPGVSPKVTPHPRPAPPATAGISHGARVAERKAFSPVKKAVRPNTSARLARPRGRPRRMPTWRRWPTDRARGAHRSIWKA